MDHPALFKSVKEKDIEQLRKLLEPTLQDFGTYQTVLWDHAADGILTSLKKIPGAEGYNCLRWAEKVVNDAHQNSSCDEANAVYAQYVYKLRAELLGMALERIDDFKSADRSDLFKSVASAVNALDNEVTEQNLPDKAWLSSVQSRVTEERAKHSGL